MQKRSTKGKRLSLLCQNNTNVSKFVVFVCQNVKLQHSGFQANQIFFWIINKYLFWACVKKRCPFQSKFYCSNFVSQGRDLMVHQCASCLPEEERQAGKLWDWTFRWQTGQGDCGPAEEVLVGHLFHYKDREINSDFYFAKEKLFINYWIQALVFKSHW